MCNSGCELRPQILEGEREKKGEDNIWGGKKEEKMKRKYSGIHGVPNLIVFWPYLRGYA